MSNVCSLDISKVITFRIFVEEKLDELKLVPIKNVVGIKRQEKDKCYGKEKNVTPN